MILEISETWGRKIKTSRKNAIWLNYITTQRIIKIYWHHNWFAILDIINDRPCKNVTQFLTGNLTIKVDTTPSPDIWGEEHIIQAAF